MCNIGPSIPTDHLLSTSAPMAIWEKARKQALRSPMIRFRAGAVIFNPASDEVISTGCSHPDIIYSRINASVHAEQHAIRRANKQAHDMWCCIFTIGTRGGCAWSSRPCYSCASALLNNGVARVIYPEKTKSGWIVRGEHPEEMLTRASKPTGKFAREQRIPA